ISHERSGERIVARERVAPAELWHHCRVNRKRQGAGRAASAQPSACGHTGDGSGARKWLAGGEIDYAAVRGDGDCLSWIGRARAGNSSDELEAPGGAGNELVIGGGGHICLATLLY